MGCDGPEAQRNKREPHGGGRERARQARLGDAQDGLIGRRRNPPGWAGKETSFLIDKLPALNHNNTTFEHRGNVMQNAATRQGEKFIEIIRDIERLSASQQKFIQDMLSRRTKVHKTSGKTILRKSFGLWADRTDISDSQNYVNNLRKGWQARVERIKG